MKGCESIFSSSRPRAFFVHSLRQFLSFSLTFFSLFLFCSNGEQVTARTVTHATNNRLKMAKSAERLPGTSTRLRTRDDGCCSVNFLKYVLHIYNVVLFVRTPSIYSGTRARKKGIFYFGDTSYAGGARVNTNERRGL